MVTASVPELLLGTSSKVTLLHVSQMCIRDSHYPVDAVKGEDTLAHHPGGRAEEG